MNCRERKRRQDALHYSDLVRNPAAFGAGVVLPANASLFVSCSLAVTSPTPVVTVGGQVYNIAAGAADAKHSVVYAEKGATVAKAAGAPGTITLYIEGDFGVPVKVAQG